MPSAVNVENNPSDDEKKEGWQKIKISGPKGETVFSWDGRRFSLERRENSLKQMEILVKRVDERRSTLTLHGTMRSLLANQIHGVHVGFRRELELVGVGYRVQKSANNLVFSLGYSNKITIPLPANVQVEIKDQTKISLMSVDKIGLGTYVSRLQKLRKIDPYKGKGILEAGKSIRRKAGKSGKVAQK